MSAIASQITSLMIVYWIVYSGTDQRKHQSSGLLAFVTGIHRWLVNSPHKKPVTWEKENGSQVDKIKTKIFNAFPSPSLHQRQTHLSPAATWEIACFSKISDKGQACRKIPYLHHVIGLASCSVITYEVGVSTPFGLTLNTLRPRQYGRHFADDIFKSIFLYQSFWISNQISVKFVPKGQVNNIPALV